MVDVIMPGSPSAFSGDAESGKASRRDSSSVDKAAADRLLLKRFLDGEESAFSDFYDAFAPPLFSLVFEILHDQKEAEDVLQDVFVQMWKKADSYDPARSNVFTWAVMIARHKAIDHLRSRQRRQRLLEAATAETADDSVVPRTPGDSIIRAHDDRQRVQTALAKLTEGQREAIDLAFFGGLTQVEISDRLSTPLGTIKARIRRGLLTLRDILKEMR